MLGAFAHPAFTIVWTASTCALIGIAMYDTASGWLMTTFGLNPFDVSLLHTATTLPIFLFTLPAGAIADIVDPRRMIVAVSYAIAALMTVFAAVVALDFVSPLLLLLTTFALSAAWSLNTPAWLSIVPQLVPKPVIPGAIAAHSVGYNLSRTLGPALGGFIIVRYGAAVPLWIFVGANLAVIAALTWWRAPGAQRASLPTERLSSALRTGLRHTANNRLLWATLVRTIAIYPFSAAYWGLLPLIARRIGDGAEHYGIMLSAISVGAILGSLGHEKLRRKFGADRLIAAGTILTVFALTLFAIAQDLPISLCACLLAGIAWVNNLTCLYTSAQNVLPDWVRGRGLAVFLTVIYGTMTLCSAAWGEIAARYGLSTALLIAAGGAIVAIPLLGAGSCSRALRLTFHPPSTGACRRPARRSTTIVDRSWSRSSTGSTPKTARRSCARWTSLVSSVGATARSHGESSRTPATKAAMRKPTSSNHGSNSCICARGSPTPIGCLRTESGRC